MKKSLLALIVLMLAAIPVTGARPTKDGERISCRAVEVFVAEPLGVTAVIFHQSEKADGPRLGELLLAHTGEQVEFQTPDGKRHTATVERVKSCFGRGLLLFTSKEANLAPNQNFAVHFSAPK